VDLSGLAIGSDTSWISWLKLLTTSKFMDWFAGAGKKGAWRGWTSSLAGINSLGKLKNQKIN
jgi:hypothetical protein